MNSISTIETIPISELVSHEKNPRRHSKKQIRQIANSIKTFGFKVPVMVDVNNRLICGHGRIEACKLLGISEIPAIRVEDLSEDKIRAYMIADNRLTEISEWDERLLAENFKILSGLELDFDLEVTGFDYGDIEAFLLDSEDSSPHEESEVPNLESVPAVAKKGDLWMLGEHRVICGDCLDSATYDKLFLQGRKASVVFTDPPYNLPAKEIGKVCEASHGNFAMGSGEMTSGEFVDFLETSFSRLKENSKSGSIHYVCMDWRHASEILSAGNKIYDEFKNLCVWTKNVGGMGSFYRSQHELVFVFKSGKGKHQNHFQLGQHGRYRSNVWSYPSVRHLANADGDKAGNEALQLHPTIKPVAMIEDALLDCSRRGEIVLDAFLGSGSTLIASEKIQRVCYGVELSPRYVDVAVTRWQQWTGKEAVHAETGASYNSKLI